MRKLPFFACLLLCFCTVYSQKTLTGKITDTRTGAGMSGVSVNLKGSKKGTSTNNEGIFTIEAKPNDVLLITNIGYTTQEYIVTERSDIHIGLEPQAAELTQVVFVGSRGAARTKTESPVPIDVINVGQTGITTARPDLSSQLNMAVPSFNYNKQSGGDGSDAIDFASLRGLGFDQTLVLVNGKRRHQSAFVNQVGTRGRGNSGTDLNAIPEAAIDRIEILRDGASAQYGSDAIAGVINIILKKDIHKLTLTTGWSGYYDKKYNSLNNIDPSQYYTGSWVDGNTFTLGLDYGLPLGTHGGFINFGGNFMTQGKTFRAEPDTAWNSAANTKALGVDDWRRAFGEGAVTSGGGMFNAEIPVGSNSTFYSFGGYNYKHSNVYAWTRRWHSASNRVKFPTDDVGDLHFEPSIMRVFDAGDGSLGENNVYYNPQEDVYIKDQSIAIGFKGKMAGDWDWDISDNIGYNDFHYYGNKTFNASLPIPEQWTKTRFNDGGFNFLQNTANLDISKLYPSVAEGLTLSFGGEFRYERYKLYAGEPDSYRNGGAYYVIAGDTSYKASGSEGYPGYQPSDEANANRTNLGGYIDISLDITKKWLIDGAARFENYSDFGFVNTYKLASRYKIADNFNLRGSVSTGFRAPTLQQINFSNTNTNIVAGQLEYIKLAPNYSPITKAAGVPPLKQETSVNGSLGFTWQPIHNLTFTVDGYWVQLKHRIVITGNFDGSIPVIAPYLTQFDVSSVNFFANAVNTTNTGLDIVMDYTKRWGARSFKLLLAGNIQKIAIDKVNIPPALDDTYAHQQAFFSTREAAFLTASAPHAKFSLALEYGFNRNFSIGTHLTYWGELTTQGFGYSALPGAAPGGPGGAGISDAGNGWDPYVTTDDGKSVVPENFVFHGKVTTDLYAAYKVGKSLTWYIGVDNITNVHPDQAIVPNAKQASWGDSESGGPFDAVQMGFNGMRMFTKLAFTF
jgi:iron complex outermembrane receptor protein